MSSQGRAHRHALTVGTVLALTLSFLVPPAVNAQPQDGADGPEPWIRQPYAACPVGEVPPTDLEDLVAEYDQDVICAVWHGIAVGTSETEYGRNDNVTRGQMASFVANLIDYVAQGGKTGTLPEYEGRNRFTDSGDSVHVANINRLAEAGVVRGGPAGRGDDEFGPGLRVRRDQMATFLNGAQEVLVGDPFRSDNDFFDRDDQNVHEDNINAIAEHGLTGGVAPHADLTTYGPRRLVARRNMGSFLMRLLDIHVAQRRVGTPWDRDEDRSNQSFVFRELPDTAEVSTTPVTDEGATGFAVTGLGDQPVSLALFHCHDVFRPAGIVTFRDYDEPTGAADLTVDSSGAVIEQVNGAPRTEPDNYVSGVEPTDGEVTFEVDSTEADCAVGVAFADGNANDALDVGEHGAPTEAFAAAGPLLFMPAMAQGGPVEATVAFIHRGGRTFVGQTANGHRTYELDDLDNLFVGDQPMSFAAYTATLSRGDVVTAMPYATDSETTWHLDDAKPEPPTGTSGTWDVPYVRLTWASSATPTVRGYRIERKYGPCGPDGPPDEPRFYEVLGEVTANHTSFDHRVDAGDEVCKRYHVRAIEDRDVSAVSDASTVDVTVHGFRLLDARVTRDAGRSGILDAGDRHRFIVDQQLRSGDERRNNSYTVLRWDSVDSDHNDRAEIYCRVHERDTDPQTTDCSLNTAAVTVEGQTHEPGRVMVVNIGTDQPNLREADPRYPLDLVLSDFFCCDVYGNHIDGRNGDKKLDR